jgi:large subunit ribosomal protein L25
MMQAIEIRGEVRVADGKGGARRARRAGHTPGILYQKGGENLPINLDSKQFERILSKHSSGTIVLDVKLAGQDRELNALVKDLQRDPLSSRVIHVDLLHVTMSQNVTVMVPVHLTGSAIGIKQGGILEHFARDLEIECQVGNIPDGITLDVTALEKGHSYHVSDLQPPEGVRILTAADRVVVGVIQPRTEVEVAPAEGAAPTAEAAAAPAAETKGKEKDSSGKS